MQLVLLSGGSGTRLWPLSIGAYAKQFLPVLINEEGQSESMLQRFVSQVEKAGLLKQTYFCTVKEQYDLITQQLAHRDLDKRIITEPMRRDTFAATVLASCYLKDHINLAMDDVVAVCPVDLYLEHSFFTTVKLAGQIALEPDVDLVMIGIKPTYAAEKYGYILPSKQESQTGHWVKAFVEKPEHRLATQLVNEGAFWNGGFFAFRLGFLCSYLQEKGLPLEYAAFRACYEKLPKQSFDYELAESIKRAKVVPYEGAWSDLGTWGTLLDVADKKLYGKGAISKECLNVHVINRLGMPIYIEKTKDVVVVACPEGVLVAHKNCSSKIKQYVEKMSKAKQDDLIAENCIQVSLINKSDRPVLAVGVSELEITCNEHEIVISGR
ncbi:MAG: hypothetical protein RLZ12_42 [Bacillota bacterium]|jgi:mannose-1-phosphate guanylyltransferase